MKNKEKEIKSEPDSDLVKNAFEQAEKNAEIQTGISFEDDQHLKLIHNIIQNPEESYNLYYGAIQKLIDSRVRPLLKKYPKLREMIYEQKNIFLTGKKKINGRRKADSRMTFTATMQEALMVLEAWILDNGSPYDLYAKFRELNLAKGYIREDE